MRTLKITLNMERGKEMNDGRLRNKDGMLRKYSKEK